jgi:hypothetical protein
MPELAVRRIERADGLDVVAKRVRAAAHDVFVDPPGVDHLLGGAWLGHRVHPLAVQVPLGGWLMATLLDLTDSDKHAAAVDALLLTGCVSALPTAITGAHDLASTSGSQTRVALVHAIVMDVALGLFAAALVKRRRGDRRAGRRLAIAGTAVAGAGGYLGGHLVYGLGVGVDER